jgi:arginine/lysine/ornithine decarboxylase
MFAPRHSEVLKRAAGKIAVQPLAPYPPGVPIVAPGERIREEDIDLLRKLWYTDADPSIQIQVADE